MQNAACTCVQQIQALQQLLANPTIMCFTFACNTVTQQTHTQVQQCLAHYTLYARQWTRCKLHLSLSQQCAACQPNIMLNVYTHTSISK